MDPTEERLERERRKRNEAGGERSQFDAGAEELLRYSGAAFFILLGMYLSVKAIGWGYNKLTGVSQGLIDKINHSLTPENREWFDKALPSLAMSMSAQKPFTRLKALKHIKSVFNTSNALNKNTVFDKFNKDLERIKNLTEGPINRPLLTETEKEEKNIQNVQGERRLINPILEVVKNKTFNIDKDISTIQDLLKNSEEFSKLSTSRYSKYSLSDLRRLRLRQEGKLTSEELTPDERKELDKQLEELRLVQQLNFGQNLNRKLRDLRNADDSDENIKIIKEDLLPRIEEIAARFGQSNELIRQFNELTLETYLQNEHSDLFKSLNEAYKNCHGKDPDKVDIQDVIQQLSDLDNASKNEIEAQLAEELTQAVEEREHAIRNTVQVEAVEKALRNVLTLYKFSQGNPEFQSADNLIDVNEFQQFVEKLDAKGNKKIEETVDEFFNSSSAVANQTLLRKVCTVLSNDKNKEIVEKTQEQLKTLYGLDQTDNKTDDKQTDNKTDDKQTDNKTDDKQTDNKTDDKKKKLKMNNMVLYRYLQATNQHQISGLKGFFREAILHQCKDDKVRSKIKNALDVKRNDTDTERDVLDNLCFEELMKNINSEAKEIIETNITYLKKLSSCLALPTDDQRNTSQDKLSTKLSTLRSDLNKVEITEHLSQSDKKSLKALEPLLEEAERKNELTEELKVALDDRINLLSENIRLQLHKPMQKSVEAFFMKSENFFAEVDSANENLDATALIDRFASFNFFTEVDESHNKTSLFDFLKTSFLKHLPADERNFGDPVKVFVDNLAMYSIKDQRYKREVEVDLTLDSGRVSYYDFWQSRCEEVPLTVLIGDSADSNKAQKIINGFFSSGVSGFVNSLKQSPVFKAEEYFEIIEKNKDNLKEATKELTKKIDDDFKSIDSTASLRQMIASHILAVAEKFSNKDDFCRAKFGIQNGCLLQNNKVLFDSIFLSEDSPLHNLDDKKAETLYSLTLELISSQNDERKNQAVRNRFKAEFPDFCSPDGRPLIPIEDIYFQYYSVCVQNLEDALRNNPEMRGLIQPALCEATCNIDALKQLTDYVIANNFNAVPPLSDFLTVTLSSNIELQSQNISQSQYFNIQENTSYGQTRSDKVFNKALTLFREVLEGRHLNEGLEYFNKDQQQSLSKFCGAVKSQIDFGGGLFISDMFKKGTLPKETQLLLMQICLTDAKYNDPLLLREAAKLAKKHLRHLPGLSDFKDPLRAWTSNYSFSSKGMTDFHLELKKLIEDESIKVTGDIQETMNKIRGKKH